VNAEIAESLGLAKPEGALVANVIAGSPAEKAGIRTGDIIVSFAGKRIETVKDLTRTVAATATGTDRTVEVWRDGKAMTLNTTIAAAEKPAETQPQQRADASLAVPALGLKLASVDGNARQRLGLADDAQGAVVVAVDGGKDAAEKGLRPGDVITRINQQPVDGPTDVVRAVETAAKAERKSVLVMVERNRQSRFVAIELTKI
jgi:serine protease Do